MKFDSISFIPPPFICIHRYYAEYIHNLKQFISIRTECDYYDNQGFLTHLILIVMSNNDNKRDSEENESQDFSSKWRQNRACARCRRLKMKCAYDDPEYGACIRCHNIKVECSVDKDPTAPYARKKPRKTNLRFVENVSPGISSESIMVSRNGDQISQLQNLIKLFQTSLSSLEHDVIITSSVDQNDERRLNDLQDNLNDVQKRLMKIMNNSNAHNLKQFQDFHKSSSLQDFPYIPFNANVAKEIIENFQLMSLEEFKIRHSFFLNEMLPYYPIISLSQKLSDFDYLYENDSLLLCGCVYVTTINDNGLYDQIHEKSGNISNETLNQMLNYYLESFISYHVYIKSDNFNYQLVDLCLILSLWCLPTTTSGHFKNQLNLLIGFNISLCIDLGDISKSLPAINFQNPQSRYGGIPVLPDDSEARNHLRAFLSVYVSCGSLGLSLPRFKLVTWTKHHQNAITLLMKEADVDGIHLPSRNDKYLCYFSRIIRLGQEIFEFFSPNLLLEQTSNKKRDPLFNNMMDPSTSSLPHIKFVLDNYEQRMYSLLVESGFMNSPEPMKDDNQPKEKYLLSVIYYQLLMIIYDNIVSRYFILESKNQTQDIESVTYIQYIIKLIKICENLLQAFIILGEERTINLPTFFFYRPMHALILLIKLRILINSLELSRKDLFIDPLDLEIDAESYYESVYNIIHESQHKYSLIVCLRMSIILSRIEKWMLLSKGKGNKPRVPSDDPVIAREGSALVNMIDTSKEIENLRAPKEDDDSRENDKEDSTNPSVSLSSSSTMADSKRQKVPSNLPQKNAIPQTNNRKRRQTKSDMFNPTGTSTSPVDNNLYSNSIQEIFDVINSDILGYLNPLDASIDFDSNMPPDLGNSYGALSFNDPMNMEFFNGNNNSNNNNNNNNNGNNR